MTENLAGRGEGLKGLEIVNYADGTHGSYCIARTRSEKYTEYWNPDGWKAFGYVFKDKRLAEALIAALEAAAPAGTPALRFAHDNESLEDFVRCLAQASIYNSHDTGNVIVEYWREEAIEWVKEFGVAALATPSPQACEHDKTDLGHVHTITQEQPAGSSDCIHVHLTKQVGPMDGGAGSKRYVCQCGENFTAQVQVTEVQFGSPRKVGEDGATILYSRMGAHGYANCSQCGGRWRP